MTIGLKRHHSYSNAGWRPRSGFNNAVSSMAGAFKWHGWGLVGTRSWAGGWGRVPMSNARACVRACARCQWRQLANYTGRLHPIADVGHPQMYVGEALNVCYEECKKEGEEIVFECVISGPKQSVTERSIRCPIWSPVPIPPPIPAERDFPTTTRELFTGHRQLGRCSGLGRTAWGGACK